MVARSAMPGVFYLTGEWSVMGELVVVVGWFEYRCAYRVTSSVPIGSLTLRKPYPPFFLCKPSARDKTTPADNPKLNMQ